MKIKNIEIINYRSIDSLKIPILNIGNKSCLIFLGKNESGKSNIINAISLLNPESVCDYDSDCNKKAKKGKEDIIISFELEFENLNVYKKNFLSYGIPKVIEEILNINRIERYLFIDCNNERTDAIDISIDDNEIFKKYVYNKTTKSISEAKTLYKGNLIIHENNVKDHIGEQFSILKKINIETILIDKMFDSIDSNTPKCIFWKPSSSFLINDSINLNTFSENNNLSIPLRNIFSICGVKDIKERIKLITNDIEERVQLKQELSKSITNYVNKVWPEHPINIFVEIEGMLCTVMIEDKDDTLPKYKMNQRSDGFKQFFSILLNLSIESDIKKIKNKIILLDEPEVHIHPSGVKYLRDELLKISESNIVIISTHSIYMVDKLNLDRHFKVDKKKSITIVKQIDRNNPYEEEVIYEALGTSVYEHIQPNMIVFEGKTDKDIFDVFTNKFKTDFKPVKIGSISADGVEKIPQYTKFIDGKFVKGFILVDSDLDGKRIKDSIIKDSVNFTSKNTFEINDILNTKINATLEDLYPKEFVVDMIYKLYKVRITFNETTIIKQIEKFNSNIENKINIKDLKGHLAQGIIKDINKLTKPQAKDKYRTYYDFIEKLHTRLH